LFGANLGTYHDQTSLSLVTQGSFAQIRVEAGLQNIYAASTANWTATDTLLTNMHSAGLQPIIVMDYNPASLQPSPNPCSTSGSPGYHAPPTDVNLWGQLAASYVAHVDQKFPGLVKRYEIWNEPDIQGSLCVSDNTDQTRRTTYLSIFAAAAKAMHSQARTDGVSIQVGGPVLGNPRGTASIWIPALLSDVNASPQVDFVSYHGPVASSGSGLTWDNSTTTTPLYTRTQDPNTGAAALFKSVSAMVRQGLQPNAAKTPVLITSYNTTSEWLQDCCRNSSMFAPLWNTLFVTDLLNSVYSGAQAVPQSLEYYSISSPAGFFCLVGNIDTNMDCAYTSVTAAAYPQYYAYKLLGAGSYLGLSSGGYMAASVSPTTLSNGVLATGFYTASKDAVVILNPTGSDVTNLNVDLLNVGFSSISATSYLLNNANGRISSQALTLNPITNGYNAVVTAPAYSVLAISINP
jgi:hypothetical protein